MRNTHKYKSLPFNPALKSRARALRRAGNLSEVLLWNQLKKCQLSGLDFDRQKIIGNYIVDFYCAERQVVIEVDGASHEDKAGYDAQRDAFLMGLQLTVIHLADADVKSNLAGVMDYLRYHLALAANHPAPAGHPSTGGEYHPAPAGHPSMGGEYHPAPAGHPLK